MRYLLKQRIEELLEDAEAIMHKIPTMPLSIKGTRVAITLIAVYCVCDAVSSFL